MVEDFGTLRGAKVLAQEPDARYRRTHDLYLAPPGDEFLGARRRVWPARPGCSEYVDWERDGRRVAWDVRVGTWGPSGVAEAPRRASTGEPYAWRPDGKPGVYCEILGGVILAEEDPEVAELVRLHAEADRRWRDENRALLRREDERTEAVARAAALDGLPHFPRKTECLECGAVYSEPGHVEAGGMGCERCG